MPSFSNDAPLELPPSPPALQDYPHSPSHEKSIMSNAFVYTNTNGVGDDIGKGPSQLEGYENSLKNASPHSIPNGRGSVSGMTGRDRANSRTGSPPSISDRTVRQSESRRNSSPPTTSTKSRQSNGDRIASGPVVNGGPVQPTRPRSPSKRTTNGDRMSEDQQTVTLSPITTGTSYSPSHQDSTNLAGGEPLSMTSTAPPHNRYSSPPIIPASSNTTTGTSTGSLPHPERHRLTHRHTLQVPRLAPTRGSRDFSPSNPNTSEDALGGGRFSPTVERTRRASLGLVRRTTRSVHSDLHLDEVPQDEDAARWTEAIRQKRASKRKRKEEEDDERVIVGTKVDQNHVNWVTAYNMLTGIRFTVSRTNAKMDRELTDADFVSAHKFSFDM
jgi:1-phosphatidylinositol-4-phosphate 5-kinase